MVGVGHEFFYSAQVMNIEADRRVKSAAWIVILAALVLIPLRIIGLGFLPDDDALRHVAKAVSGREWQGILVTENNPVVDHNAGWHAVLRGFHWLTGATPDTLIALSVAGLFLLVVLAPVYWLRRPEAWAGALLVTVFASPALIMRLTLGRPLLVTMAVLLALLFYWNREGEKPSRAKLIFTTLLFALSVWVHGAWYLWGLLILAYLILRRWQDAAWLAGCWAGGTLLGALFTGHPVDYLINALGILGGNYTSAGLQRVLPKELMALDGDFRLVIVICFVLFARWISGRWTFRCAANPAFVLMAISWVLSFQAARFWLDWGTPAALVWISRELTGYFETGVKPEVPSRMAWCAGLAMALFLVVTSDHVGRWTNNLTTEYLSPETPGIGGWLPEEGGVVYNADMAIFYNTFFKNPQGKWRYMLGYEPTLMPREDLQIYRRIQFNGAVDAYRLWVRKMKPADRLMLHGDFPSKPPLLELEWRQLAGIWIGKLPIEKRGVGVSSDGVKGK